MTRAKNELIITRNISSIYSESRKFIRPENTNENNEALITIEEQYFLNGLPDEIAEQGIIEVQRREIKDLEKPNSLNIDYGMDFG